MVLCDLCERECHKVRRIQRDMSFTDKILPSLICETCHRYIHRCIQTRPPFTTPVLVFHKDSRNFELSSLNTTTNTSLTDNTNQQNTLTSTYTYENITLTGVDAKLCFSTQAWWNDNIMDLFISLFKNLHRLDHILLQSHFINTILRGVKGKNDNDKNRIFSLLNDIAQNVLITPYQTNNHWVLIVIDMMTKSISLYNTYSDNDVNIQEIVQEFSIITQYQFHSTTIHRTTVHDSRDLLKYIVDELRNQKQKL